MEFSNFGRKFTQPAGIIQLMDDLADAVNGPEPTCMLGGGNPGQVPAVQQRFAALLHEMADNPAAVTGVLGTYDGTRGKESFISALVDLLRDTCGWEVGPENVVLTNGSQNAFFYLFNLLGGRGPDGRDKRILLPLIPEYIGYADVFVEGRHFLANKPIVESLDDGLFKYHIDFDALTLDDSVAAVCVSRPTNPTGNVLTDDEIEQLDARARAHGVPLIIDNAYGLPFPNIVYTGGTPWWNDNIVMCLSLSKFGLPGLRTGIVVAREEIARAVAALNGVVNLAPGGMGAALATPLVRSGEILQLSREVVRPYYERKARRAVERLRTALEGYPFRIHKPEGALFLWLWLEGLPITAKDLYERLKARRVIVIPGHHFFPGLADPDWRHPHECIRITYAQDDETVDQGIAAIAEEVRAAFDSTSVAPPTRQVC